MQRQGLNGLAITILVETPFMSSIARVEGTAKAHEWQTDSLDAAANNAAVEGDDAPESVSTPTVRLSNLMQISTKDARVSGTGRAVDTAGRADELDYQILKRGRELKRDMETALLGNKPKVADDGSAQAGELAGVPAWLTSNTNFEGTGADPTGDGTDARSDGVERAFAEDDLRTVIASIFDAGGNPDTLMVGAFNRQAVSRFGTAADVRVAQLSMADDILHTSFQVYESDFGQLKIIPNRFQRARDAFLFQMDMWAVAYLPGREFAQFPLAKTGDSDARQILSEYTLEARNEAANGAVYDLTTAP